MFQIFVSINIAIGEIRFLTLPVVPSNYYNSKSVEMQAISSLLPSHLKAQFQSTSDPIVIFSQTTCRVTARSLFSLWLNY